MTPRNAPTPASDRGHGGANAKGQPQYTRRIIFAKTRHGFLHAAIRRRGRLVTTLCGKPARATDDAYRWLMPAVGSCTPCHRRWMRLTRTEWYEGAA